jgi:hypothetical protein
MLSPTTGLRAAPAPLTLVSLGRLGKHCGRRRWSLSTLPLANLLTLGYEASHLPFPAHTSPERTSSDQDHTCNHARDSAAHWFR